MIKFLTKAVKNKKYNCASLKFVNFQGINDEQNKTERDKNNLSRHSCFGGSNVGPFHLPRGIIN